MTKQEAKTLWIEAIVATLKSGFTVNHAERVDGAYKFEMKTSESRFVATFPWDKEE